MTTTAAKRTMKNPEAFVGKRMNPDVWNIPAGYGLCRKTTKLHPLEALEVTFAHWKFEDSFLKQHGIYVEDAELLSEEGYDEIMAKLEALGLKEYYIEYPALPFPGSQPVAEDTTMNTEVVPAELAGDYDDYADFVDNVERFWNLDECLLNPCPVTLAHALELMRREARAGGYDALLPMYEQFVDTCEDDALLMDADKLLEAYAPKRDEADRLYYGLVRK